MQKCSWTPKCATTTICGEVCEDFRLFLSLLWQQSVSQLSMFQQCSCTDPLSGLGVVWQCRDWLKWEREAKWTDYSRLVFAYCGRWKCAHNGSTSYLVLFVVCECLQLCCVKVCSFLLFLSKGFVCLFVLCFLYYFLANCKQFKHRKKLKIIINVHE